ncbi:MAG: amidophosphoribosyltransferase [Phycisphaerae bacterium]|nr:amidophosphoribosyltransferase [Phycisphaerae bacterium]
MGGFFGVARKDDCVADLFYGTDYHSHLGTKRGGMASLDGGEFARVIHDITNAQFRSKFDDDIDQFSGSSGIGVISDHEDQPLIIGSHLGTYAIVTVGRIANAADLARTASCERRIHFSEMSGGEINPTELVATLINLEDSFTDGLRRVQQEIVGSCSILLLTSEGIYAARDKYGRTPIVLGRKDGAHAATLETCAFPNLGYEIDRDLGPGEIVRIRPDGAEQMAPPGEEMRICAFLWVYYGFPASHYEGINVEVVRNRCGAMLAQRDETQPIDLVAGIPDSGTAHAVGYADAAGLPYRRPFIKYTPTWPRSFMPQNQTLRNLVARMKLIPIPELIADQRLLFVEDSIVRGTQLRETIRRLFERGAKEVHMRPACPPLVHGCKFLNFSQSRSEMDLAGQRAARTVGGDDLSEFTDPDSDKHCAMVENIRKQLGLTSLKYQRLDDLVAAIGLPREKLCTYCWDGCE